MKETKMVKRPSTTAPRVSIYSHANFVRHFKTRFGGGIGAGVELTQEEPLPSPETLTALHLQDARGKDRAERVSAKHSKEKDSHTLGELSLGVPRREGVDGARDVTSLGEAEDESRCEETGTVGDEELQHGDETKDEHLAGDILARTKLVGCQ